MNSIEHEALGGLKALGLVGVLRLCWPRLVRGYRWAVGQVTNRQQQQIETQKVEIQQQSVQIERQKIEHTAEQDEAVRLLEHQKILDAKTFGFIEQIQKRLDAQDKKIDGLESDLRAEVERRTFAGLTAEAAHIRADEADKRADESDRARVLAMAELAELRRANVGMTQQLLEATAQRDQDKLTIAKLGRHIEDNMMRIRDLEDRLSLFEHGEFTLTRKEKQ